MAAVLQHLDLDIYWEQWDPPAALIDKRRLSGAPQHGIGRPCKVGKETIIGLLVALQRFVAENDESRTRRFQVLIQRLYNALSGVDHADLRMTTGTVPKLELHVSKDIPRTAMELCIELERGDPSIHADASQAPAGVLVFNPWCLRVGDPEKIAARVKPLLRY
jgi:L-seryl-tRNA(Ser) seleniumtransferase